MDTATITCGPDLEAFAMPTFLGGRIGFPPPRAVAVGGIAPILYRRDPIAGGWSNFNN